MGGASSAARSVLVPESRGAESKTPARQRQRIITPSLELSYGFSLVQGRREYQEDRVRIVHPCPSPENREDRGVSFFAVYDGHAGEWAANYLVHHLHEVIARQKEYAGRDKLPALAKGFLECDAQLLAEAAALGDNSGATAVVAVVDRDNIFVGNVGDSRCVIYRCERKSNSGGNPKLQLPMSDRRERSSSSSSSESSDSSEESRSRSSSYSASELGGDVEVLTVDHKPTDPAERKRITAAGANVLSKYIELQGRGLAVSRAFGDPFFKANQALPASQQAVVVEPHLKAVPRTRQDQFLILASDGLWNVISEREACAYVLAERRRLRELATDGGRKESRVPDNQIMEEVAHGLTQLALDRGSKDNVACVIVEFRYTPSHTAKTLPKDG